ncbi:MAG: Crp/Fnr family transcriptional regulator [Bacteroidetes bacterium]|nr:Crp/Fnr family transcriptional regulator [Bacteroidota bacterium]
MNIANRLGHIFEPELLEELDRRAQLVSLKEGESIIASGQTIRAMPIVLSGTLKISRVDENGRELLLYYVNPGESCAMTFTCCMQQYASDIKAVADNEVELLSIPVAGMDEWLVKYPTWTSFVMKTIHTRFNELLKTIDQIAFQKLDERLVYYLKEKSKTSGSTLLNLSHEQIAVEMATSREVISRLLKKLENDQKLLLYRNQIKLLPNL